MAEENRKILLIEEEKSLAKAYSEYLQQEGFEVAIASDGQEGILKASSEKPDLILLDVLLPKLDGLSVMKHLKDNPDTKDIPVVVLSNLSTEEVIRYMAEKGSKKYLVKSNNSLKGVVNIIKDILN